MIMHFPEEVQSGTDVRLAILTLGAAYTTAFVKVARQSILVIGTRIQWGANEAPLGIHATVLHSKQGVFYWRNTTEGYGP